MSDHSNLPLVLLYTKGREAVDGATRFQKLIFLAQKEEDLPTIYDYEPGQFGPYSPELHADLRTLADLGYVERHIRVNDAGNEKYEYSLTREGIQAAQSLVKDERLRSVFDAVEAIKNRFNDDPIGDLLRYVYQNYPDYATETELDLERLFDTTEESQFIDPDTEETYIGPGPGEWKSKNPSPEEFFSVE